MTNSKCVHAPKTDMPATQIPDREHVFMRSGLIRVMYDASEMDHYLESTLAAERASRVQADTEMRAIAQGVVNEYSECQFDENRPALRYCFTHSTKRCTAKETYELAQAALTKPSVSPEQAEETK